MPDLDLRALIQQRKADGARGTVKCLVCLDPDLLPELDELTASAEGDSRMVSKYAARKKELERQVAEHTVTVVFSVPTRAQKAQIEQAAKDDDPNVDVDLMVVTDCFLRFEKEGQSLPLGRTDWLDLLDVTPPAEVNAMASRVYERARVVPDFPESLAQSVRTRASAGTSRQQPGSASAFGDTSETNQ